MIAKKVSLFAALFALAGCGVAQGAGAAPQQVAGFSATCTTNSTGYCTVPHTLGVVPSAVTATPRAAVVVAVGARTATTLTVRLCRSLTSTGACTAFVGTSIIDFVATYTPATPSTSATPSVTNSTPTTPGTTSPSPTETTPPPVIDAWPNPNNTGVPAGWTPVSSRTADLTVTTAGAVVEDVRITGANLIIKATGVTVRRVEIVGGVIDNAPGSTCYNGLTVQDTSILKGSTATVDGTLPAIGTGGYTARRVKIQGWPEGFRVSGRSLTNPCTGVSIADSWAQIRYPDTCNDWHGDGVQGYDGAALTISNTYLELIESGSCSGTAAFFYPANQGNVSANVNRLITKGGGYPFRLGTAGTVTGLRVVQPWGYGPTDVSSCGQLETWSANRATLSATYQPTDGATIPCG